ncbi:hypothetical protein SLS60_011997 [Paraconiothyrium brasiliense]|uniref:MoaB/Mog domain-containing protein n=1 Tax=Paraconiothyrium brasiliense TaxID=300254 RepID=A0ABR3QGU0_9PLEO
MTDKKLKAAILVVSETASHDPSTDKCIPVLQDVFANLGNDQWEVASTEIIPDSVLDIQKSIRTWTDGEKPINLIVTSGGTGFATKDVTPEGAKENLEAVLKLLPHACVQAAGAASRPLHMGGVEKLEKDARVSSSGTAAGHAGPIAHTTLEDRPQSNDPSAGPTRRYRSSPYPMLAVDEALKLIEEHTPSPIIDRAPVDMALGGSVLAEDVKAVESVPAFRASIVDGYAISIPSSGKFEKGVYPVALVSHAQAGAVQELKEGQIARITTGAPLPPGADAVVMVEDTVLHSRTEDGKEEKEVEILTDEIKSGENVREVGSDVKEGDTIMKRGEGITVVGGEFGLLASVGTTEVSVYRRPVVGVLSTGDEIIPHDRPGPLSLGEVRDTNRPTLLTAVRSNNFEAVDLGIVSDKPGALEDTLRSALAQVDVIITSGGVSMGELDLLKPTIERSLGGTIHFGRVNMKPGKPTTFATVPTKHSSPTASRAAKTIFSLPGNPASAVVTFHLFVLPSLHKQVGIVPAGLPRVKVALDADVRMDKGRPEYHRAVVAVAEDGGLIASSTGGQRSSRIGSFKGANALLCMPAGEGSVKRGDRVDALLMGKLGEV